MGRDKFCEFVSVPPASVKKTAIFFVDWKVAGLNKQNVEEVCIMLHNALNEPVMIVDEKFQSANTDEVISFLEKLLDALKNES